MDSENKKWIENRSEKEDLILDSSQFSDFMEGKRTGPVHLEISPSGRCNQHCKMCYVDYLIQTKAAPSLLSKDIMFKAIREAGEMNVRSIVFCGTGEPLLNRYTPQAICEAGKFGITVGLFSNGVLAQLDKIKEALHHLQFLKISSTAGSPERYAQLQGDSQKSFAIMLQNLQDILQYKQEHQLQLKVGVSYFLFDGAEKDVFFFAQKLKSMGVSFLQIKPCGDFLKNNHYQYEHHTYHNLQEILQKCASLSDGDFECRIPHERFTNFEESYTEERTLPSRCWALHFTTVLGSCGNLYTCGGSWYEKQHAYGSLHDHSFREIWNSQRWQDVLHSRSHVTRKDCFLACRNLDFNRWMEKTYPNMDFDKHFHTITSSRKE